MAMKITIQYSQEKVTKMVKEGRINLEQVIDAIIELNPHQNKSDMAIALSRAIKEYIDRKTIIE